MKPTGINSIELYHIVHIDRLPHILAADWLLCDSEVQNLHLLGTTIGMSKIKERRMNELTLNSYPDLHVGECVPFYFCPRSVMLYIFYQNNHLELAYRGGQESIVHLVFNMMEVIDWANQKGRRWAFTDSNAGSRYFNDYCDLTNLDKLNWSAIRTDSWSNCREEKQAEFLVEKSLPWRLVREIGVYSPDYYQKVCDNIATATHKPTVKIIREWYY